MCFTEGALSSCEVFGIGNPEHNAGVSHGATERRAARLAALRCSLHSFQPAFGTPFSHAHTHKTQPKGSSSRRPSAQPSEPRGAAQSARWAGTEGRPAPLRSVPFRSTGGCECCRDRSAAASDSAAPGRCFAAGWDRGGAVRTAVLGGSSQGAQERQRILSGIPERGAGPERWAGAHGEISHGYFLGVVRPRT